MKKNGVSKTFFYSFKATLPVMAGYMVLGIGFGILMQSHGYSVWWSTAMSAFIYAGSMQYVAVDLLSSGATIISAALMTVMVNARHILYGISMLAKYKNIGKIKPYLVFSLTDETYSLVCAPELPDDVDSRKYMIFVSLLDHFYWIFGSFLGGLFGSFLKFNTKGIDFAMTALFVTIFVEQWEKAENHLPAIIGLACTVLFRLLFGASDFLIPSMISMIAVLFILRKPLEKAVSAND